MRDLVIIEYRSDHPNWMSVTHLSRLAARMFDAELISFRPRLPNRVTRLLSALPRRRRVGKPDCLVIARFPAGLELLSHQKGWRSGFNRVVGWVIDSYWEDRYPKNGILRAYDQLFITHATDVELVETITRTPTRFLGWGSDVLDLGGNATARDIAVLRLGRQPDSWKDDAQNAALFGERGFSYHGSPRVNGGPEAQYQAAFAAYKRTRFTLAHTNLVDDTEYTHPQKEYITARWTDALACGATVIGVQPSADHAMQAYLWPEATVDLNSADRNETIDEICHAVTQWTPERAQHNYQMALKQLDWRWRLKEIAMLLDLPAPNLRADLARLSASLGEHTQDSNLL